MTIRNKTHHAIRSIANKKFNIQLFSSSRDITKRLSLSYDNTLLKDSSQCGISDGHVNTVEITPHQLSDFIDKLLSNQAIGLSNVQLKAEYDITSFKEADGINNMLRRTKDNFCYQKGPAVILLDVDPSGVMQPESPKEVLRMIAKFLPIKPAAMVIVPSTSANVSIKSTGEKLTSNTNLHIYLFIKDASVLIDNQFLKDQLLKRAWLAGVGYMNTTKKGNHYPKCPIDLLVFSPERLVFEANAVLSDDLIQNKAKSKYRDGNYLNLSRVLKPLTSKEEYQYNKLIRKEKLKLFVEKTGMEPLFY